MRVLWFAGEIRDPDLPVVTAFDRGFTVGDGVFETLAVVDGMPFAISRHLDRLERSCHAMGLAAPARTDVVVALEAVSAELRRALAEHARVRVTWTAGSAAAGTARDAGDGTLVVTAETFSPAASGPRLVTAPWPRDDRGPLHRVKSTSYAVNVLAQEHARRNGGTEALLANSRGELCEGSSSNVFIEHDGAVWTPPLSAGCLDGVTRALLLEWASVSGVDVRERRIHMSELGHIGHVAISSSLRGLIPAESLDDRVLSHGPLTRRLAETFTAMRGDHRDP